jgi:hypothetical protein
MTNRKQALIELRDKAAVGEVVQAIDARALWPEISIWGEVCRASQGSVDAALAFLAAVLPNWTVNQLWQLRHPKNGMKPTGQWECLLFAALESRFAHASAKAETPARALLLATLNALIAEDDSV